MTLKARHNNSIPTNYEDRSEKKHPAEASEPRRTGFICFVGIDGSGKTLQAERLVDRLNQDGEQSIYLWCRYSPRLLMPFIYLAKSLTKRKKGKLEYENFTSTKKKIFRNPLIGWLWLHLSMLEHLIQVTWIFKTRARGYRRLICDRYVYDMIADLAVNLDLKGEEITRLAHHWLVNLFPRPDLVLFLDVPPEIAFARKNDPNILGKQYLVDRAEIYSQLSKEFGFIRIDGTKTIEEIAEIIYGLATSQEFEVPS